MFKTKPFAHQLEAYDLSNELKEYALFMEQGTGKSKVLIDTLAHLYRQKKIDAAIVIAGKGVYLNWLRNELPAHMPVPYKAAFWSTPMKHDDKFALKQLVINNTPPWLKVLLINTESFSHPKSSAMVVEFLQNHRCLMCIDESTSIKNHQALRTKTLIQLGKGADYRRIMTGTPITKNPLDLFAQCQFLNPDLLGYQSYYAFRARYAQVMVMKAGLRSFQKVVGFRNIDKLTEAVKAFSYRKLKSECLDLPEKLYETRYVELTGEQQRVYNQVKTFSLAELRNGTVTVQNVLTKMMRLHQIVCGHTVLDDKTLMALENNRVDVLLEAIEETDGKVIIWATYQADIEAIANALTAEYGHDCVAMYYGKTSVDEREMGLKAFQDPNSSKKFFLGSPTTGGKGLTLVSAATVIYYSSSYDLEARLQSEDRAHRIGQTKNVTYIDLVSPGTVDEKILRALKSKKSLADMVLDDGKDIQSLLE